MNLTKWSDKKTVSGGKVAEESKSLGSNFSTCLIVGINQSVNSVSEIPPIFYRNHIALKRL